MKITVEGLPAHAIRTMARRAQRLRAIIVDTGASSPKIAEALRLRNKTVQDWREGNEMIPANYFEVIWAAYAREQEDDPNELLQREFLDYLPILARAARLPGFESD